LAGASNLVFIDPSAIRRSASSNAVAAQESPTMATTSSSLARAFGIVLRQISELVGMMAWKFACPASNNYQNYDMTYQEAVQLQVSSKDVLPMLKASSNLSPHQMSVERRLKPTWDWILTVMDATEAQLRFGASLTDSTDAAHPLHPSNNTAAASTSTSSEYHLHFPRHFPFLIFIFSFFTLTNPKIQSICAKPPKQITFEINFTHFRELDHFVT
jgi:E3 ubiquitin-protein ligase EDD1